MAETSSLLNCRTGNRTAGSNPALTATGRSVARLSRLLWEQEVAGSNPAAPTKKPDEFTRQAFFMPRRAAKLA